MWDLTSCSLLDHVWHQEQEFKKKLVCRLKNEQRQEKEGNGTCGSCPHGAADSNKELRGALGGRMHTQREEKVGVAGKRLKKVGGDNEKN